MQWQLTYRAQEESASSERTLIEADTSGEAVQILRQRLPEG